MLPGTCNDLVSDSYDYIWASQVTLVAGDIRDTSLNPGLGKSSGGGHGNPLQYSCVENAIDRGAWWTTVHGVTKSLKPLSMHACKGHQESTLGHWENLRTQ